MAIEILRCFLTCALYWFLSRLRAGESLGKQRSYRPKQNNEWQLKVLQLKKITHGSEAKYGVVLFAYAVRHFASGVVWFVKSRCRSKAPFKTNFGIAISVVVTVNSSFHWLENVNNSHRMKASESRRWSQSSHGLWFFSLIWHQILLLWRYPRCEEVRWP